MKRLSRNFAIFVIGSFAIFVIGSIVFIGCFIGDMYEWIYSKDIVLPILHAITPIQFFEVGTLMFFILMINNYVWQRNWIKIIPEQEKEEKHFVNSLDKENKKLDNSLKLIDENQKKFGYHNLTEMNKYLDGQLKEVHQELKHDKND